MHKVPVDDANFPLIIVGAHRSGTTMLAEILEQLGVFMGRRKDRNNEALFFRELNRWMFHSIHAHWDYPQPFAGVLADRPLMEKYVQYLNILLPSPRLVSYMGFAKYLRYRHPGRLNSLWGWKDPRNTFTLPIWLEVFGGARVIHVRRHGVDVAGSLYKRNSEGRKEGFRQFEKWRQHPLVYRMHPKRGGFVQSMRCLSLAGAFDIWHEYMAQAVAVLQNLSVPCLDLCYEQILEQPAVELEKLLQFCNLLHLKKRIPAMADSLQPQRAFAYRRNPEMRRFASERAGVLKRFGYLTD